MVEPAAPTARVRTCAIDPPVRVPQQLQIARWLGRIGDRSYLIARHDQRLVLVSLTGGTLTSVVLGLDSLRADAVTGTHLWLAGTREHRSVLLDVDLSTPGLPAREPELLVTTPLSTIDAIAVGSERQLIAERGTKIALQLYDRAAHKLGPVAQINTTDLQMPELRCAGDRCFAVGVEGDGADRRIYVERFAPDGSAEHEVLADDHVATLQLASLGARTIVLWTAFDHQGVFMRALDPSGKPLTRRTGIAGIARPPVAFELLPAAPPRIALKDASGAWTIATLDADAHRLDEVRALPLPSQTSSFTGAVQSDGILGAGFSSQVDYQGGTHAWTARATAVFLPTTRDAEAPVEVLPTTSGEGRGGMAAFPLVEPGHAAVLVLPQGDESEDGGELVMVRKPCT